MPVTAFDPRRPELLADPYPALRALQEHDPVHRSEALGGWVLTRYADVRAALADPRLSADRLTPFAEARARRGDAVAAALARQVARWAVFTDPPTHTRLRGLLNRAFTARVVEPLRPRVEAVVAGLLDRVAPTGQMDVIRDLAGPLPVTVIAELLGVPEAVRGRLKGWSDELAAFVGSALGMEDKYARAARGLEELSACFRELVAARRRAPEDDLVSALVAACDQAGALSEEELVATCVLLLFAGHETTTNLIGNGVLALLRHPEALAAWRADPGLTPGAVEELLRYDGPGGVLVRIAREALELGGRRIEAGERVFLMILAANRDPRQFPDPDRLDLHRHPNPHLTFGSGAHFCLGAPLARLEAQVAFPMLLARCPDLRLVPGPLEWLDSLVFRGLRALPVSFAPRGAAS